MEKPCEAPTTAQCLSCERPECYHDLPLAARRSKGERDAAIRRGWAEGASVDELARRYRLRPRTIYRIIS